MQQRSNGSASYRSSRRDQLFLYQGDLRNLGATESEVARVIRPFDVVVLTNVFPVRYAGPNATDEENVARLLEELQGTGGNGRRARYVSELVILSPHHEEARGTGTLEGAIAEEPRGSEGFGYDPVFVPDGERRTVAELGDTWKAEHSHRARAAAALRKAVGSGGAEE